MIAFTPAGDIQSFTAATTAPTAVQSVGETQTQAQQYKLDNVSSTVDAVVGWGATAAEAQLNAGATGVPVAGNSKCMYLLHSTVQVVTAQPGAYFSGSTTSSTAVIKVQAGYGN